MSETTPTRLTFGQLQFRRGFRMDLHADGYWFPTTRAPEGGRDLWRLVEGAPQDPQAVYEMVQS